MCKHQTKQQFLLKLEAAKIANSLPDSSDLERVTGCKVEDFDNNPTAIKSAYEFGMNFLFQAGDPFAIRCSLMQQLNLPQYITVEN